jgi:hypothetical protein
MLDAGLGIGLQSLLLFPIYAALVALYAFDNYYWRFGQGRPDRTFRQFLEEV